MGREQQLIPKPILDVFGEARFRQTLQNPATQNAGVAIVNSIETILAKKTDTRRGLKDTFFRVGPQVTFELFSYEDQLAQTIAPKDNDGRPYLAVIENVVVETDKHKHVTAREHVYVDHEYNVYTRRTASDIHGQETTVVIPSSYDDVKHVSDIFDRYTLDNKDQEQRKSLQERMKILKATLFERPEFMDAFEATTERTKEELFRDFWIEPDNAVTFFMRDRLVEVTYRKDLATTPGTAIPNEPDTDEELSIMLYPTNGHKIVQTFTLSTNPQVGISYSESDGWFDREVTSTMEDPVDVQLAYNGADVILRELKGDPPEGVLVEDTAGEIDCDNFNDLFIKDNLQIVPQGPLEHEIFNAGEQSAFIGNNDQTLDLPFIPFDPRLN